MSSLVLYTGIGGTLIPGGLIIVDGMDWSLIEILLGFIALSGVYTVVCHIGYRLYFGESRIWQTGIFHRKSVNLDEVDKLKWRCFPAGGSVVIFRGQGRFVIDLGNFESGDRRAMIEILRRSVSVNLQVGWQQFDTEFPEVSEPGISIRYCLNPWWSVGLGLVTFVGNSWHTLGILAGWNGVDVMMRNGGWIVMMVSLMLAMYVAAISFVFFFSRRDWRFGVGFVLSAIGMAVVVADLFRIPGRII